MFFSAREVSDAPENASNDVSDEGSMPSAVKLRHKGGIVLAVTQILFIWDYTIFYFSEIILYFFPQVRAGNRSRSGLDKLVREPQLGEM